jgi:outer membrane immunogenic protein
VKRAVAGMSAVMLAVLGCWQTTESARAADLDVLYQAPPMAPPAYPWGGYYFGLYAGGAFGKSAHDAPLPTGNFNTSGAVVGGTIGFNFLIGGWVAGIEFDAGWANIRGGTATNCLGAECRTENSGLVTLRGRAGPAFGRVLPYVTAGVAFGEITPTTAIGTGSADLTGYTVGAGVEVALTHEWFGKIEYLYVDLGSYSCGACAIAAADHVSFTANIVRAGLNYKFGW